MDLIIGEHPESVDVCLNGKAWACRIAAGHNPSNKGAMTQPILQCLFVCPICTLPASDA